MRNQKWYFIAFLVTCLIEALPLSSASRDNSYALAIDDTIEYYLTNKTAGMWTAHLIRVQLISIDSVFDNQLNEYISFAVFLCESRNIWEPNLPPVQRIVRGALINETSNIFLIPVAPLPQVFLLPLPLNFFKIYSNIVAQLPSLVSSSNFGHILQFTYISNNEPQFQEFAFNDLGILTQYHFRNASLTLSYTMITATGEFPFVSVGAFCAFFIIGYILVKKYYLHLKRLNLIK